jgi:hypothetical protein
LFSASGAATAPKLAADARLKRQNISMSLRVSDLSGATRTAVRRTRRLGGYVAAAEYSTSTNQGASFLDLRVPAGRVQAAIAGFTELGDILSQHIAVQDLQAGVDRLDTRIIASEKLVKSLTGEEQKRAALALGRLERKRAALVSQAAYARISLQLTSSKPAKKQAAPPGRFDRFWDDAGDILSKEAVGVLYALVILGPFLLLAAFAILAERERRRRSGNRLLEEAG